MEEEEKRRKELKSKPIPRSTTLKPSISQQKLGSSSSGESSRSTPEEGKPAVEKRPTVVKKPAVKDAPAATIRPPPKTELDRVAHAQAVLKARKEASEKGRQTVKMWAEMQKQKEERAKAAAAAASSSDAPAPAVSS
jgi:hypothetical protein